MIKITIRDLNQNLIQCLKNIFIECNDLIIFEYDKIFKDDSFDAIVSPANSFGFMDGGIDQIYTNYFGLQLQKSLRDMIKQLPTGELVVGMALGVETGNDKIPLLISAPTMRVPEHCSPINCYLSTKAAISYAITNNIKSVLMPGMGTGVGGLKVEYAAQAMKRAIMDSVNPRSFNTLREASQFHQSFNSVGKI